MPSIPVIARLTGTTLVFLLAAIFACRPAFSPDGKRILVPVCSAKNQGVAVALFERATGKITTLYRSGPGFGAVAPLWSLDGKQAVAICVPKAEGMTHGLRVALIDLQGEAKPVVHDLRLHENGVASLWSSPILAGGGLLLSGKRLKRVDLATGAVTTPDGPEIKEIYLTKHGSKIYYARDLRSRGFEFGTLNPKTLVRTPMPMLEEQAKWRLSPLMAISPDGQRFALAANEAAAIEEGVDKPAILICSGGKLVKTLPVTDRTLQLGNLVWSPDGERLFASAMRKGSAEKPHEYLLLELAVDGSAIRQTRLFGTVAGEKKNAIPYAAPIALSPDGKTIAACSTAVDTVAEQDRALYLVGVGGGKRPVQKVPTPEVTAKPAARRDKK